MTAIIIDLIEGSILSEVIKYHDLRIPAGRHLDIPYGIERRICFNGQYLSIVGIERSLSVRLCAPACQLVVRTLNGMRLQLEARNDIVVVSLEHAERLSRFLVIIRIQREHNGVRHLVGVAVHRMTIFRIAVYRLMFRMRYGPAVCVHGLVPDGTVILRAIEHPAQFTGLEAEVGNALFRLGYILGTTLFVGT